jgi:2-dehydro-3-deoxygalactonokinase
MKLQLGEYILSCDWGTSSFRLRLAEVRQQQVIGEVVSQEGNAKTNDLWLSAPEQRPVSRLAFYGEVMEKHIGLLQQQVPVALARVPVVLSGMASSSIGMAELPYASLPFPVDGSQALAKCLKVGQDQPRDILLISGVRSERDVMRGEETQLVGLVEKVPLLREQKEAVFIFPGTHSKHMFVKEGKLRDFQTFMTGELFQLMVTTSILKNSVEGTGQPTTDPEALRGFRQGIAASGKTSLLPSLFSVRTNHVLDNLPKRENFYYLSGLLIGAELRTLLQQDISRLVLGSGSNVYELYHLALQELGLLPRTTLIPAELMDQAAIAGQVKIFQQQEADWEG